MDPQKLGQQIDDHQLWLESRRLLGAQAVFRGQDLRFAALAGKRLNECVLAESNLERADLRGVSLAGADIRKVNLAYANLAGANLSGANLSGARLEGAILDNVELREALIEDAQFDSASLKNANLSAARGARAKFNRADLSSADLDAAVLPDSQFNGANMTQSSLRETLLDRAQLRGAALSGAQIDGTSLREALLLEAILVGVSFESSNIEGARLDRNALGGGDPEEENESASGKKSKAGAKALQSFSGATLSPNAQMAQLLRRRDELQQDIRTRLMQARSDGADALHDEKIIELRAMLDITEGERRVLRQEIRRGEEHRRNAQTELQGRVEAASVALRSALDFTNRQIRRAYVWSIISKTFGLGLMACGSGLLLLTVYRLSLEQGGDLSGTSLIASLYFLAGLAVLVLDHFNSRNARSLVERRERIENVIAALNASLQLSVDVEANQASLIATFESARAVLLGGADDHANREHR